MPTARSLFIGVDGRARQRAIAAAVLAVIVGTAQPAAHPGAPADVHSAESGTRAAESARTAPAAASAAPATRGAAPAASPVPAAIPTDPAELRKLVLDLDARMFAAYDAHDVDALMAFFAPELEFFHDTGGLLDHDAVRTGFRSVFANNPDIRRELIPDSTTVHPIAGYGALQFGRHRFCHTEHGRPDCGTFGFVQVWRLKDGRWQVTRELSFGH